MSNETFASILVYGMLFTIGLVIFSFVMYIFGRSLKYLIPLAYLLLFLLSLPLYIPYWWYTSTQPVFQWADKAKQSAWFDFKKMLLFWSRLLTLRRPFLY